MEHQHLSNVVVRVDDESFIDNLKNFVAIGPFRIEMVSSASVSSYEVDQIEVNTKKSSRVEIVANNGFHQKIDVQSFYSSKTVLVLYGKRADSIVSITVNKLRGGI